MRYGFVVLCLLLMAVVVVVFAIYTPAQAQSKAWISTPSGIQYTDEVDGFVRCYQLAGQPLGCTGKPLVIDFSDGSTPSRP